MKVLQNKAVANIAKEFFVLSKHLNDNKTILFVFAQENEKKKIILRRRWGKNDQTHNWNTKVAFCKASFIPT